LTSSGGIAIIDIYAGGLGSAGYGFGTTTSNIASPGPTINLKVGDQVTINFHNNSQMGHDFAVVTAKTDGNTDLAFTGAQIASASDPVPAGGTATPSFTVDRAGTFYYICQVDAHVSLGMWGVINVTS
jgi:plastocyanin